MRLLVIALYRLWFYILLGVPIIIMLPYLIATTISERTYPYFYRAAQLWALLILYGMGFRPKIKRLQKMKKGKSYMIIANHTSMTDIMTMLVVSRNPFVFVGKKELAKIPLFGFFYRRTNILVDRRNAKSRQAVFSHARRRLQQGVSICIFPEGGVPENYDLILDSFKDGAFRLALEHEIPIVPITLYDNKRRLPYKFDVASAGKLRIKVDEFIETKGHKLPEGKTTLKARARKIILNNLESGPGL